jgi:hypothetical protein
MHHGESRSADSTQNSQYRHLIGQYARPIGVLTTRLTRWSGVLTATRVVPIVPHDHWVAAGLGAVVLRGRGWGAPIACANGQHLPAGANGDRGVAPGDLYVPRIPSTALTSTVTLPAVQP